MTQSAPTIEVSVHPTREALGLAAGAQAIRHLVVRLVRPSLTSNRMRVGEILRYDADASAS